MKPVEIEKLIALAEEHKARDLSAYAERMQKVNAIKRSIEDLKADIRQISLGSRNDFVVIARWQGWAEQKQQRLEHDVFEAVQAAEELRHVAVKSSARVHALEILLKKSRHEQLQLHRRRAEQNGMPPDA